MRDNARVTVPTSSFAHLPASRAEAADLLVYDREHLNGDPWQYTGVFEYRIPGGTVRYRLRFVEAAPWGGTELVDLGSRFPSAVEAAKAMVRYLKWRHGDAWRPSAPKPDLIDVFNDAVGENEPASWVGRVWVNGVPELAFADDAAERGFAFPDEAMAAARELVRAKYPDWRNWLSRTKRAAVPVG